MEPLEHHTKVVKVVGEPSYLDEMWLPKNACSCCSKEIPECPCMLSICFKPNYMFCSCFERIFSGVSTRSV